MKNLDQFRSQDGWIHHWEQGHPKHEGAFPDSVYITGLAYLGTLLRYHPFGFSREEEEHLESGFYSRWDWDTPGCLVRDSKMTGTVSERMLNRDQWQFILYPLLLCEETRDDAMVAYHNWRDYATFRPRHWNMPNHSAWFNRCLGGIDASCGDWFEYCNVLISARSPNRTVSSAARILATLIKFEHSDWTKKAWKELNNKTNVLEDFEEYFTRSIPGDPLGKHPRVDKIWEPVIKDFR